MSEINYHITELMNECLDKYGETFSHTLDMPDYVPPKVYEQMLSNICKEYERSWKKLRKANRLYQKNLKKRPSKHKPPTIKEKPINQPALLLSTSMPEVQSNEEK